MSLRDQVADWNRRFGLSIDYKAFGARTLEIQLDLVAKTVKPDQYLIRFLEELKSHSVPMGVGTSSSRKRAEKLIEHLGIAPYFSALITAHECANHKPSPDIFLKVAESLDMSPEYCVVVEDAMNGIEAAKRGGMKAVGFLNKYSSKEELRQADFLINGFSDMSYARIKQLFND